MSSGSLYIVGASANIFGISGAFLALFMKERMRIFVSFFLITSRVIVVPVLLYFVVWVAIDQVLGVTQIGGTSIAYLAHIAGFSLGFALCFLYQKKEKLPDGIVYPYEKEFMIASERTVKPLKLLQVFIQWQNMNPASRRASMGLLVAGRMMLKEDPHNKTLVHFLKIRWSEVFNDNLYRSEFVAKIPLPWLGSQDLKPDPERLRLALDAFHVQGHERAEWVLLVYILWGQAERGYPELDTRLKHLCTLVFRDPDFVEFVQEATNLSPELAQFLATTGLWLGQPKASYAS